MTIPIEKNIPVPEYRTTKYPFGSMAVGDSFLLPHETKVARVSSAAAFFAKSRGNGHKFTVRTLPEGVRCWRTA